MKAVLLIFTLMFAFGVGVHVGRLYEQNCPAVVKKVIEKKVDRKKQDVRRRSDPNYGLRPGERHFNRHENPNR